MQLIDAKQLLMKTNYFAAFTPIVLATGLFQPIAQAQGINPITTFTTTQVESQFIRRSDSSINHQQKANILSLGRKRTILVSRKEDPLPPRPSPPGGSR